jgi:hypothetical protein
VTFRLEHQLTNIVVMYQNLQHQEEVLATLDTGSSEILASLTKSGLNEDLREALAVAVDRCHEAQETVSTHKAAAEALQHALEAVYSAMGA